MSFGDDAPPEPPETPDLVERALELAERMTAEQRAQLSRRLQGDPGPERAHLGRMVGSEQGTRS